MVENQIDVSVIVPAYNSEKVIERAVRSVQKQSDLTWEIIIIENGSGDGTYDKCCELSESDERIKVLHSEKGVSKARNMGILNAVGEWICFLDADDFLYENTFSSLKTVLQRRKTDFVIFGHNSNVVEKTDNEPEVVIWEQDRYSILRCEFLKNPTQYMPVWGKLFLREIVRSNDLLFDEELELAEDADFTFRYMKYCDEAVSTEAQLYHYSRDESSTVRTYKSGKDIKYMKSMNKMKIYIKDECDNIKRAFNYYVLNHLLLILVHDTYSEENPLAENDKKQNMKKLLNMPIFNEALKKIRVSECRNFRMLPILCFKFHLDGLAVLAVKIRIRQNKK